MNKILHPDPNTLYPIAGVTRTCFLKNIILGMQLTPPATICSIPRNEYLP